MRFYRFARFVSNALVAGDMLRDARHRRTRRGVVGFLALSLVVMLGLSIFDSRVFAWDPPDGPATDQATQPATPTTLLPKAHGYIIQNGISILYNDGYWFAAQTLWNPANFAELVNGVRYADVYEGRQAVDLQICEAEGILCQTIDSGVEDASWPYGADNHYFNPDTGKGLQAGFLDTAAYWSPFLESVLEGFATLGLVDLEVDVQPPLASEYPSALSWLETEFTNASSAYLGGSPPSISGRTGIPLAMFYLGWASHLMQDQSVVHHTFDQPRMHHAEYEGWADADTSQSPPAWTHAFTSPPSVVGLHGTYSVPVQDCNPGSPACFGSYLNLQVHDSGVLNAIDAANGADTASVQFAIPLAESAQAGLYAAFFTAIGQPPVHMSAVIAAISVL